MELSAVVNFLDKVFQVKKIGDFANAFNGLQLENNGTVTKIAGAVDADRGSIEKAIEDGVDLLCVHHGLYWHGVQPMIGEVYELFTKAMRANLAVYSVHLPLDSHRQYGHNITMANKLQLSAVSTFAEFFGNHCGLICSGENLTLDELVKRVRLLFPKTFHGLLYGTCSPKRIGIVGGSGSQALLDELLEKNIDTLITGEVRYSAISFAQLHRLNIFACGHYATESFGVRNILALLGKEFHTDCKFISFDHLL